MGDIPAGPGWLGQESHCSLQDRPAKRGIRGALPFRLDALLFERPLEKGVKNGEDRRKKKNG